MTSEDRRLARKERRISQRKAKSEKFIAEHSDFEQVCSLDNLHAAYIKSRKGVSWKESVQHYDADLMFNLLETRYKLLAGKPVTKGFVEFDIHERGKIRHIRSVHISERVVQKSLCDNALVPLLSRSLIYDNGASVKNKGIHFAMNRCRAHLHRFYCENKTNEGYALVIDFSKYFDNIRHDILLKMESKKITDPRTFSLYKDFVKVFGDELSLGLGSQVSQISAISLPNPIDHYIKEVLHVKYYARYMDDSYLFDTSKEYLEYCLSEITKLCDELGIKINTKKTKIVRLDEGFWFLKGKYILTSTGKIVCRASRDGCIRMRRKLKKFKVKYDNGEMSMNDIYESYQSFRSHLSSFDSYHLIKNMDQFFKALFHENKGGGENGCYYRKCILSDKRRCSRTSYGLGRNEDHGRYNKAGYGNYTA